MKPERASKARIDILPIIATFAIILTLFVSLIINPAGVSGTIANMKTNVANVMSPAFLWLGLIVVIFLVCIAFSKYGNIRLGKEKPEYGTFAWVVMMFCAGMGTSLLYWAGLEWMYYYSAPPMGAEPFSKAAAELSMVYGNFHWSITAWSLYAVGAVALAYRYYVRKKPGLTLTGCCERALGDRLSKGLLSKIIEIMFVFGLLAGLASTLAFGVPMIANNIFTLTGIPDDFRMNVILIIVITVIFAFSTWTGLSKGMQFLSTWSAYIGIALALFVLIAGPTLFEIKSLTNSLGYMFQNFLHMSLWTDFVGGSGFPESWTAFYWAWWLSLGPWMWIFIAKISRGRTLRQMILGVVLAGSAGCWLYFGTLSSYGLYQQLNGLDLIGIMNTESAPAALSAMLQSLPFGKIFIVVWAIVGVGMLATTMDSAAYTLAAATTKNLGQDEHPARFLKMFWAIMLTLVPLGYMFANAPMEALQGLAVLCATPIAICAILSIVSAIRYVREDYGKKSAQEIIEDGQLEE